MKRGIALSVTLAFLAGCTGAGGGNGFVPGGSSYGTAAAGRSAAVPSNETPDGSHQVHVALTMRIPRRHRREHEPIHPSTISPATKSVSIAINGAAPRIFNATPSSAGCGISGGKTVCTFAVVAPVGSDTFAVKTYSAINGTGAVLNYGTAVVAIVAGKANTAHVTMGLVVTTTADSGLGSLRSAIGSANPGDTIIFLLPTPSTITLSSPITINTAVNLSGPGVTTATRRPDGKMRSNLTFSGITISGGGTQQILVINAGVSSAISGLIFTHGKATTSDQPGGAIYNAGAVALSRDAFVNNTSTVKTSYLRRAPHKHIHAHRGGLDPSIMHPHACPPGNDAYGGAVYNHGLMTVTGSTFSGNSLNMVFSCYYSYGAAIYNDYYGTLTSSGNTYTANSAYEGGAVYNNSDYGQASFTSDTFTGNLGCTAANGCPSATCGGAGCTTYPLGYGAAIADNEGPGITITSSTFTNNVAGGTTSESYGEGGALYLDSGGPSTISGSTFTGNKAGGGVDNCSEGYGGAVATYYPLELENDTFTGNLAGGDSEGEGGAVYADGTDYLVTGGTDTFKNNTAKGAGSACVGTNGKAYGGAVYTDYGATLSGSTFSGNLATSNHDSEGGGLYSDDASTLTGLTFTSNVADATGALSATANASGGGLYVCGDSRLSGSAFSSNTVENSGTNAAYAEGGGAYSCSTLASLGNKFTSNKATESVGTSGYAQGGGLWYDSDTSSNGDTFISNAVSAHHEAIGGGVYADGTGSLSNDTFTSNTATTATNYAYGGGLALESNPITVASSTFTGNKSTTTGGASTYGEGGAIYDDGGNSTINAVKITGNTTSTYGGGIEDGSTEALNNSTVSGNVVTASQDYGGGGGIYADSTLTVTNSVISGNAVAVTGNYSGGGGIYNNEGVTLTGSTVSGNKVTGTGTNSGGGAFYDFYSATLTNDTMTGNSSSKDGGAIEVYDPGDNYTTTVTNVTLYQNTATGLGGNIYNPFTTTMTLANTIVAGGNAASGKDINNTGGNTASADYNLIQTAVVGNALGGTTTHDINLKSPVLLALAANGGPTPTNAESSTSPGAAAVPWSAAGGGTCGTIHPMPVDQRGFTRGAASGGTRCDVGAFERAGVASSIVTHVYAPPIPRDRHAKPHHHNARRAPQRHRHHQD